MSSASFTENSAGIFSISGELSIYCVASLMPEVLMCIFRNDGVQISLAGVHDIDSAGIQLLIHAKNNAKLRGKSLRYCEHSDAVIEAMDLCNLCGVFGDPIVIPQTAIPNTKQ